MTRLFYTTGNQDIIEEEWEKPEIVKDEIEVKSLLTGVCRSDIDMYTGAFQLLPKHIQGHESLGIVTKVGGDITTVKEGDYVATRGEPAFADFYNCKDRMFVKVPEASPRFIIEPVACAINIATSIQITDTSDILILGSGFLATIIYATIARWHFNRVIVVGKANPEFWSRASTAIMASVDDIRGKKFKYVIDVSEKPEYLDLNLYGEGANIVLGAEKHPPATLTFSQFLWNAVNIKFPSPRNEKFYDAMVMAVDLIDNGVFETSTLWTKSYDRDTSVHQAFDDGVNRPHSYSRGYIQWK